MPRRRVPDRATPVGAGRVFLPVMLAVFGLGTLVLLVAEVRVLTSDPDPSPWFVLSVFATAIQLAAVVALGFKRRWGAKVLAAAFVASVLLDFASVSGLTTGAVLIKIIAAGVLATAVLVRWDDLVA
ncbi:hypothetical protein SAMN05421837_104398 [Amycolatopsis pretoriensis]|uniref:Uncharacterized protein n=1 Tax=Amycolatopsis pretoriensis TaxID=218821 RepID=A0A1H5QSA7_9PSEU|nr:hypothetical protein [Amycolatopsis pretoriensis]SEF28929.1 hypothetical protein SAMN05421837_104398 [Amycolatopsis pretoriensis]